jgi:hypothetical protein
VGALALAAASFTITMWAQPPPPGAPAAKGVTPGPRSLRDSHDAAQADDRLAILETQVEAKRMLLRIDESRLEQAKRWEAYYEKLVRDGKVLKERLLAAREDLLMLDAHVAAERAELNVSEMRLKNARRHVAHGDKAAVGADEAREELEILEALLESKRGLVRAGESRAAEVKRAEASYEKLFRDGMATEDLLLAARDDVLLMDAVVAWARADLKVAEIRVQDARRLASHGGSTADGADRRLAALEERLAEAEMRAEVLLHEVGRLRRELPRETHGAR